MQTGGILSVSVKDAETAPDGIVLAIQDNGMGIAADDVPKVFNAFFTTRNTVGTGIGLFIAKQFVEGTVVALKSKATMALRITAPSFASSSPHNQNRSSAGGGWPMTGQERRTGAPISILRWGDDEPLAS